MAINRTALAKIHTGATATASLFPSGTNGYDAALDKQYAYNPAAAKKLLAQAGYPERILVHARDHRAGQRL